MKKGSLSTESMILYLLNLIRYDIPILITGKSSIGKSFTILDFAKQWGMPNSVLYVGSEKADNIEGLPKLIQSELEEKTSEKILEYFKPYWFPKSDLIQKAVKNGQDIFDGKIMPLLKDTSGNLPYETIMGLLFAIRDMRFDGNNTKQRFSFVDKTKYITTDNDAVALLTSDVELERTLVPKGEDVLLFRNDLYELSLYLCTLVGLGNYWLVLDELDKVQEEEKDKFAPMLHIVRERRLKNYSLREFNNGEGADVAMNVTGNSYLKIYNTIKESLAKNLSVLDTRIIAISNQTRNILDISDALFKRFVQVAITDVLISRPVSEKLNKIKTCLSPINDKMSTEEGVPMGFLDEINLQWQFGFLPRILNNQDTSGNFIKNDFLSKISDVMNITDREKMMERLMQVRKTTVLWKLVIDNYSEDQKVNMASSDEEENGVPVTDLVMDCLAGQLVSFNDASEQESKSNPLDLIHDIQQRGGGAFTDKDVALEVYDLLIEKYNNIQIVENKRMELESLIDYAFSFITHTAYADGYTEQKIKDAVPYSPLEINKYLIPLVIKFTLKAITKDDKIGFDDKDFLLSRHAELWDRFAIPEHIDKIKGDAELTNKLFYGGDDSLWGSADLNADDFQNSFVNAYNSNNMQLFEEFVKAYLDMDATKRAEFTDFIDYINKYRIQDVRDIFDSQKQALISAKNLKGAGDLRKKYVEAFKI